VIRTWGVFIKELLSRAVCGIHQQVYYSTVPSFLNNQFAIRF
jgi:hypothetical protein